MDLVIGHCPKCLSKDIENVKQDYLQCLDCKFVFAFSEIIHGVDPEI